MAPYKLLLVDDNPKTQNQVRAMFSREPIEVTVADNVQQALAQVEAERPNLVLASANRTVDGYAVAHYVSNNPQLQQSVTVLLLLTPKAVSEPRIAESGASGFLLKPLRVGVVVPRVREALGISLDNESSAPAVAEVGAKGDLNDTYDAIDAHLKDRHLAEERAVTTEEPAVVTEQREAATEEREVSTEVLAQIVAEAVTQAIGTYEHARLLHRHGHASNSPSGHPPHDAQLERLQHEMGLDELGFVEAPAPAPAPPADPGPDPALAAEMGVTDFVIEDPPTVPLAETAATTPVSPDDEGANWLADQLAVHGEPQGEEEPDTDDVAPKSRKV